MPDLTMEFVEGCGYNTNKITAENVADAFQYFIEIYQKFREDNGLIKIGSGSKTDMFEMCTALMDKSGRIARQIKHKERNDPKSDWPDGMTEALCGFIVYSLMICSSYKIDISPGFIKELSSAIKQHSKV